jgi:hypothetical protein
MHFSNQPQIFSSKTAKTVTIKIELHDAPKTNSFMQQLLNTPIRSIRLPRLTPPNNNSSSTFLLDKIQIPPWHPLDRHFIKFMLYYPHHLLHDEYCIKSSSKHQRHRLIFRLRPHPNFPSHEQSFLHNAILLTSVANIPGTTLYK